MDWQTFINIQCMADVCSSAHNVGNKCLHTWNIVVSYTRITCIPDIKYMCFLCIQWTHVENFLDLVLVFQWLWAPSLSSLVQRDHLDSKGAFGLQSIQSKTWERDREGRILTKGVLTRDVHSMWRDTSCWGNSLDHWRNSCTRWVLPR